MHGYFSFIFNIITFLNNYFCICLTIETIIFYVQYNTVEIKEYEITWVINKYKTEKQLLTYSNYNLESNFVINMKFFLTQWNLNQ